MYKKLRTDFYFFIGSQGEYFNMIGSNIVKSENHMEIFFKLGNCLVFDLHHEITDGHFIHLRSVFIFSLNDPLLIGQPIRLKKTK